MDAARASGEWLSLAGEPGVGKLALLRAVHQRRNPAGTFHVLDAAESGDHDWMVRALGELLEGEGSLVIRHIDRLSAVRLLLARLKPHGRLVCSPEAMQLLLRSSWPGNTEQLWQVLGRIVQHRRSGIIHPGDLPPECSSVSRRMLGPLESMERHAIVAGLLDHKDSKAGAAQSLGISRATIYRKVREYGLVTPAS